MSAYTAIARYFLNEASSGTTPTTIADSVGSNPLTINYKTNKAAWVSVTAGKGLDFTTTGGTVGSALARCAATTGNLGSAFSGKKEASAIVVFRADAVPAEGVLFNLVDDRGYDGSFGVRLEELAFGQLGFRVTFASDDVNGDVQFYRHNWFAATQTAYTTSAICVLHIVVDTTQATDVNRVKVWMNGVQLSGADEPGVPLNATITTLTANDWLYVGNGPEGPDGMNIDGAIFYLEVGTGQLTAPQIASTYAALIAANDVSPWSAAGPSLRGLGRESGSGGMGPALTGGIRG